MRYPALSSTPPPAKAVGLIGGLGAMGQVFKGVFEAHGATVQIGAENDCPLYSGLLHSCEVIVISVPIAQTTRVIEQIAPHLQSSQLLCDLTSLKQAPIAAMLTSAASVIGCHPLFGPKATLTQERIALCPVRPGEWLPWLTDCFRRAGLQVLELDAQTHDRAMAVVQSATHFVHMVYAEMLHELTQHGTENDLLAHILSLSTPAMRMHLQTLQRVLGGNPNLYAQIQTSNPNTPKVLEHLLTLGQRLAQQVAQGDVDAVVQHYQKGSALLTQLKKLEQSKQAFQDALPQPDTPTPNPATPKPVALEKDNT